MITMDDSDASVADRRKERRQRVFKGARLRFNGGFGVVEGAVRNQSQHGAQISFGETIGVPSGFDLAINGAERMRAARVRWRLQTLVGVQFID